MANENGDIQFVEVLGKPREWRLGGPVVHHKFKPLVVEEFKPPAKDAEVTPIIEAISEATPAPPTDGQ